MKILVTQVKSPIYYFRNTTQYSVRENGGTGSAIGIEKLHSHWMNGTNRHKDNGKRGKVKRRFGHG